MPITVSIVEDREEIIASMEKLIDGAPGFRCLGAYRSAEEALEEIPKQPPQVVLMDINLPEMSGIECVAKLKQILPEVQVMMLTVYEDSDQVFQALAAGACGYMVKRTPPAKLLEAIREVHGGGSPMSSHIARKVVQSFLQPVAAPAPDKAKLSEREEQVLQHLAKGSAYKQIADDLGISIETVRTYIRRIYEKLHVQTRIEAVVKYLGTNTAASTRSDRFLGMF